MNTTVKGSSRVNGLSRVCYAVASLAVVCGVALGIFMGINDDHTLAPVHAHLNLICWVSVFLFGVYYHLHPNAVTWVAKLQVAMVAIGAVMTFGSLAIMLTSGDRALLPVAIVGSILVFAGFLVFCGKVWRDALKAE
jgi:uncharacterized membrane protein YgdD (TMEM256/DUF423 family)